jgi:broad specificity phosphatase PhoE
MATEKIWKEGEWTNEARQIIDGLKEFPDNSKIILVLRHSHRNAQKALEGAQKTRLTPQGHEIAKKFGESLPRSRSLKIFHSIIWRCEETANDINEGFKNVGGSGEVKGKLEVLANIGITNREFYFKLFNNVPILDAFYRWVVGFYNPNDWTPFNQYCQSTAHAIMNQTKNSPENGLDIFVTHDFNIIALRFGWFALPLKQKWVDFLGGFAFIIEKDQILLLEYGDLIQLTVPHWLK